jgi:8-oxo-dGTP pyrophosphatase MutT (NUDIX family)
LPKGRIEPGESDEECAVREVREESGLAAPVVVRRLGVLHNRFAAAGKRVVREEIWFLMHPGSAECAEPERQWTPIWVPSSNAEAALTFEPEKLVMRWALASVGPTSRDRAS